MEDYFILKNILIQGLKAGYKKRETGGDIFDIDMHNGNWKLSNGINLGSSWDIILSKDFANALWRENATTILQKMVIMDSQERLDFLKQFVDEDKVKEIIEAVESGDIYEAPADALMTTVRESLGRLKEYSIGLYKDSCQDTYNNLKDVVSKTSVTQLNSKDFIILNAMDRVMATGLSKHLSENGKSSFTICPECSCDNFTHTHGCSIDIKSGDWLIDQNDGC